MEERELLQIIAENTDAKDSFYVVLTTKQTSKICSFSPPIIFRQRSNGEAKYEMALVGLNTFYTFPNVDQTNNKIKLGRIGKPQVVELSTGSYEVNQIQKEIHRKCGWKKDAPITFKANNSTLTCIMTIKDGYEVNFSQEACSGASLGPVLGFDAKRYYKPARYESQSTVDILRVNSVLVYCDIITGSRVDGVEAPLIYHFSPNVAPGIKIVKEPQQPVYLPITVDVMSQMTVWLRDQDQRPIDLRGEKIVFNFHIRAR